MSNNCHGNKFLHSIYYIYQYSIYKPQTAVGHEDEKSFKLQVMEN